jgi:hypothetical protein
MKASLLISLSLWMTCAISLIKIGPVVLEVKNYKLTDRLKITQAAIIIVIVYWP